MFKVVGELKRAGVLEYSKDEGFKILNDEIRTSYENMTDEKKPTVSEDKQSKEYIEWLKAWIDGNDECDVSLEFHHFFLDGSNLFELTRRLLEHATKSIQVINPYVDEATLGRTLRSAAKKGVDVHLITRQPIENPQRWGFHKTLVHENVHLYYSGKENIAGGVHSKLLIVDDEVVIVSSMNFTSHSESYNFETGIITVDRATIESAKESFISIREKPETVPAPH